MAIDSTSQEGPRVLGLGLGLFLLVLMWSFTLLILLACSRISPALSTFVFLLTAIITAIIVSIPRSSPKLDDSGAKTDQGKCP